MRTIATVLAAVVAYHSILTMEDFVYVWKGGWIYTGTFGVYEAITEMPIAMIYYDMEGRVLDFIVGTRGIIGWIFIVGLGNWGIWDEAGILEVFSASEECVSWEKYTLLGVELH